MAISAKRKVEQLEAACREAGIRLMSGDLKDEGGFCRLRSSFYLVTNRRASAETRVRLMTDALAKVAAMKEEAEDKPEVRSSKPESSPNTEALPAAEVHEEPVGSEVLVNS